MNVDGTNDRVLGVGNDPRFSPDGAKIAFGRRPNPTVLDVAVFTMNVDGGHLRQVTPTNLNGAMPDWAPDKDLRRLTNYVGTGVNAHEAVWSPNGQQVLFTHWDNPAFSTADLYVVNVDGTGIANVTNTTEVIEREADWETLTED